MLNVRGGAAGVQRYYHAGRGAAQFARYVTPRLLDQAIRHLGSAGAEAKRPERSSEKEKGGAAPLRGSDASYKRRRRDRRAKAKKCNKLSGYALKKEVCKLQNSIKELKHSESASLGQLTYRRHRAHTLVSANNLQNDFVMQVNRVSDYETVLAQLLYYNPSAPATLTGADGTTGTYQKEFLFKSVYSSVHARNNYQTDCEVIIYLCCPKVDTNSNPDTAWDAGIADDAGNTTARTEYGTYPTDYDTFRDTYKAKRVCSKWLSPGQSTEVSYNVKNIMYDPAFVDTHSVAHQRKLKTFNWLVLVKGGIAHDPVITTEQGVIGSGVDIIQKDTYVISYDAGINMSYVYLDNTLDNPTNGFVQSQKPISDNQIFERA